ncbi:hypothetical protein HID58_037793 [Brassica napus]|uniref:Uncharacterized protein n=1 Tax=Brassica napus TaxID=3708 RepID=A0ABQ8BM99_BRANA|nr:hypothetical protein HID58_037793 [Brassica napus]
MLDGEAGNVCIKGLQFAFLEVSGLMNRVEECMGQDPGILRGRILARLRIRGMRSCNFLPRLGIVPRLLSGGTFNMFVLVLGDNLVDSWNPDAEWTFVPNPEAEWTIVLEPGGWIDYRPGTRRLVGLSSLNLEAGWTIVLEPGGWIDYRLRTRWLFGEVSSFIKTWERLPMRRPAALGKTYRQNQMC